MPIEQTSPLGPWPEGILPVHCSECRLPLCIGMPREEPPKRLVGTCVGCGTKYVIAWTADGTEALIGRLRDVKGGESPEAGAHQNARHARGGASPPREITRPSAGRVGLSERV